MLRVICWEIILAESLRFTDSDHRLKVYLEGCAHYRSLNN